MKFTKLNQDHYIFSNNLLKETDEIYETKTNEGKHLFFWVHGDGLIPLHTNPSLETDIDYRARLKILIFGAKEMKERLKAAK